MRPSLLPLRCGLESADVYGDSSSPRRFAEIAMTDAPYEGYVALVTGASSGIGEACARLLRSRGAVVETIDRDSDRSVDVTDPRAVAEVVDDVRRARGHLDVLINCAGVVGTNRPAAEVDEAELREFLDINLVGLFTVCRACHPLLRVRGGAIVNATSQAALVSLPDQAAYSASKGGVAALSRSLAIDWAKDGIRVNAVAPGVVITPMTAEFRENERFVAAVERRIALSRMLTAEEVAEAMIFLGSPRASGITGVTLPVDGGWTAGEPGLPW